MDNKFVTTSVSTKYQDLYTENPIEMKDYTFSIAFGSIGIPYEILTDDRYFNLDFLQYDAYYSEDGEYIGTNLTYVDYARCNESDVHFKYHTNDNAYFKDFI